MSLYDTFITYKMKKHMVSPPKSTKDISGREDSHVRICMHKQQQQFTRNIMGGRDEEKYSFIINKYLLILYSPVYFNLLQQEQEL